jgi:hypothetical protein
MSGASGVSPVDWGRARVSDTVLGRAGRNKALGHADGNEKNIRRAPKTFKDALGDAARDSLSSSHLFELVNMK